MIMVGRVSKVISKGMISDLVFLFSSCGCHGGDSCSYPSSMTVHTSAPCPFTLCMLSTEGLVLNFNRNVPF